MKNKIFSVVVMAFVLVSCDQKSKETTTDQTHKMNHDSKMMDNDSSIMHNKSNTMENHEEMYACSMHPEVRGKKNEKCYKCGMKLTELVPEEKE